MPVRWGGSGETQATLGLRRLPPCRKLQRILVRRSSALGDSRPRETAVEPLGAEAFETLLAPEKTLHRRADGTCVVRIEASRRIVDELHQRRRVRRDDSRPARQRLGHGQPETLVERGEHDQTGSLIEPDELLVGHEAREVDAVGNSELPQLSFEAHSVDGLYAADDEELVPEPDLSRQAGVRAQKPVDVLARLDSAGVEDEVRFEPRHVAPCGAGG